MIDAMQQPSLNDDSKKYPLAEFCEKIIISSDLIFQNMCSKYFTDYKYIS